MRFITHTVRQVIEDFRLWRIATKDLCDNMEEYLEFLSEMLGMVIVVVEDNNAIVFIATPDGKSYGKLERSYYYA